MNTYTVPNLETAEGLTNIGPAGKSFLVCRGIAGGVLTDESPVIVDRAAMLIWMAWATAETLEVAMADAELFSEPAAELPENDDWDSSTAGDPNACVECGGSGRVLDGERCQGCGGLGRVADVPFAQEVCRYLLNLEPLSATFAGLTKDPEALSMEYLRACGITDPEYIGMVRPDARNPFGYYRGPGTPATNPLALERRPRYLEIHDALMAFLAGR